jgi:AcrR family transcriptional regulator
MTDQREPTLRQRKHAAMALSIERSAIALVADNGFDRVTVDMICEAAGVSQRTFFNYFKTKDAAVLGTPPELNERDVREFLASDAPELLREIMSLLLRLAPVDTSDLALAGARMRIISESPVLLKKEMERLFAVRAEMEEILFLRMRRAAPAAESPDETRDQAALITHVLGGVMRFTVERWGSPGEPVDAARVQQLLTAVMPKLLPDHQA